MDAAAIVEAVASAPRVAEAVGRQDVSAVGQCFRCASSFEVGDPGRKPDLDAVPSTVMPTKRPKKYSSLHSPPRYFSACSAMLLALVGRAQVPRVDVELNVLHDAVCED